MDVLFTRNAQVAAGGPVGGAMTMVLLRDIRVLAVNPKDENLLSGVVGKGEIQSITLLASPDEALTLDQAQLAGTLHVTLRGSADAGGASPTTTAVPAPTGARRAAEETMAGKVQPGMRAFTIPTLGLSASLAGFLMPGDSVDVIHTPKATNSPTPGGPPPAQAGPGAGGGKTRTILEGVRVLAVHTRSVSPQNHQFDPTEILSVTLLVDPDGAEMLDEGQNSGSLSLSLRNPAEAGPGPGSSSVAEVGDRLVEEIPPGLRLFAVPDGRARTLPRGPGREGDAGGRPPLREGRRGEGPGIGEGLRDHAPAGRAGRGRGGGQRRPAGPDHPVRSPRGRWPWPPWPRTRAPCGSRSGRGRGRRRLGTGTRPPGRSWSTLGSGPSRSGGPAWAGTWRPWSGRPWRRRPGDVGTNWAGMLSGRPARGRDIEDRTCPPSSWATTTPPARRIRDVLTFGGRECPASHVLAIDEAAARLSRETARRPDRGGPARRSRAGPGAPGEPGAGSAPGKVLAVGPTADAKLVLRALRAGAADYIDSADLEVELEAAVRPDGRGRGRPPEPGRLIAVLSPNGGGGSSTVAVNLAVALARLATRAVGLLDMKLETGDLAALLDLRPTFTLADLCQNAARLDRVMFERSLVKHESGVHLLAPPLDLADVGHVRPDGVALAVSLARASFPTWWRTSTTRSARSRWSSSARPTSVLVVFRLEFASLRNVRRSLEHLEAAGIDREKVRLVVNRSGQPQEVPRAKAEEALGMKIAHFVPEDAKTVNRSNNHGRARGDRRAVLEGRPGASPNWPERSPRLRERDLDSPPGEAPRRQIATMTHGMDGTRPGIASCALRRGPGSWGYGEGPAAAVEPTALAGLALRRERARGRPRPRPLWLARRQAAGRLGGRGGGDLPEAGWATAYACLLWAAVGAPRAARAAAIAWLLASEGADVPRPRDGVLGHDPTLVGWPWIDGTASWVEPTALALLALGAEGRLGHPRASAGLAVIRDRAIPGGRMEHGQPRGLRDRPASPARPDRPGPARPGAGRGPGAAEPTVGPAIDYLRAALPGDSRPGVARLGRARPPRLGGRPRRRRRLAGRGLRRDDPRGRAPPSGSPCSCWRPKTGAGSPGRRPSTGGSVMTD